MDNSRTKSGIQEEFFFLLRSFLKAHDQEIMNVFKCGSLMQEHWLKYQIISRLA